MPINIKDNVKPKAGNAVEAKEKDDASKQDGKKKENQKPNRDNRPKSDILQHNGISSPNVNSWASAINNPDALNRLQ